MARHLVSQTTIPKHQTQGGIGFGEIHERIKTTSKGIINVGAKVGSQNCHAAERFQPLQQVGDFYVRIAIFGIGYLTAFAEQCVGFVKEDDPVHPFRSGENSFQVFLGFTNIFVDDGSQIHLIQLNSRKDS